MGWELRKGRWYLYRNKRVGGRPVKEYLAAAGDFGAVMAWDLDRLRRRHAKVRRLGREVLAAYRARIDSQTEPAARADGPLRGRPRCCCSPPGITGTIGGRGGRGGNATWGWASC